MNAPLSRAQHPHMHDEYPSAWIFEKNPITEEEALGCMSVFTSEERLGFSAEAPQRHAWNHAVR
eukprot:5742334-Pyramimonas_sp.AAC.1